MHFANTLFQMYYTEKKLTNQERDCGIQAPKLATLTFITIPLIKLIKLMLCETVAKKEHFKNIQCGSYSK